MIPTLLIAGPVLLVLTVLCCRTGVRIARLRRDLAARRATLELLHRAARRPGPPAAADLGRLRRVEDGLAGGFPAAAAEDARKAAAIRGIPVRDRLAMVRSVAAWQRLDEQAPARTVRDRFDLVVVSHFGLPGGTTSANEAEIRIWHEHGLKVGLIHHPVYAWGPNAPVHPRIRALVDAGAARLIDRDAEIECDLALVRLPTVMERPLERRPAVKAARTAVLVNQTPYRRYDESGPHDHAWDIATVARNVEEWLGRPTWYAGGPLVLAALRRHHAAETAGLDLAAEPWNEAIAVADWRLGPRRTPDGRIRIGRHSRDDALKWPEDPQTLLQCYPEADPFEIHVLGGADAPRQVLGRLPANWTVRDFGALTAREFLARIDVMVYFIASDGLEAFGRAPLEAMAAGVPVIMDPRFEPTFGPAAVYCAPEEVADAAARLAADAEAYAAQRSAAWDHLERHFSARALMDRLRLGAPAAGPRQRTGSGDGHRVPAGVDDRR
ncbi:glycosyltransferase [Glycomyces artemisiae]|uniref:Glycosyl transferase family 1 n=1 Tax=Glycomyces artemisiae TaxID=1076443 RepID=A0A2T0UX67_9ACTN|nr:glycosyltransferase [Glycomyces artemisiae]PRY62521.1 glycosyl transferase family 1 [Glycomyces artemisiae]